MSYENKELNPKKAKLRRPYRLVVMNDETFEEVGTYRINRLSIYTGIGISFILITAFVVVVISFTPLRKLMPGYKNVVEHEQLLALYDQIEDMQEELESHRFYSESFRKILVGEVETSDTLSSIEYEPPGNLLNVERVEEDEELRQELALDKLEEEMRLANVNSAPRNISLDQMHFFPPVNGSISAQYMPDKKHFGVDVMAPKNTPIKSIMDGFVILSNRTVETGNTIAIQHNNNIISFYKHNSALLKKVGEYVRAGEAIAIIGNSGTLSSGPHLHFELWHNGKTLDPADYIQFSVVE